MTFGLPVGFLAARQRVDILKFPEFRGNIFLLFPISQLFFFSYTTPVRIYSLPCRIDGIIFDIDKTLYDNEIYAQHQIDILIERLARELSQPLAETQEQVRQCRNGDANKVNVSSQSLGNIFVSFGIPIETSVAWREELISPKCFLQKDEILMKTLSRLAERYKIMAVTNNPVRIGRETLATLGVEQLFQQVFGLDSTMTSKPNPDIFRVAVETLGCRPQGAVSVGDRYTVDIEPALSIGMGGILVDGVADVYTLPDILAHNS